MKIITDGIGRLLRDDRGTTMTEFVITLPVMIIIFAGIAHLGRVSYESVRIWSLAHARAFDRALDAQSLDLETMTSDLDKDIDARTGSLLLPATAAASSLDQLREHPPAHDDRALRLGIVLEETKTFGANTGGSLASHGHWGEAAARTFVIRQVKDIPAVGEAVSANPSALLGPGGNGGSHLASNLVFDSPSLAGFNTTGSCSSLLGYAADTANDVLTGTGVRPALAASMQYGTVTDEHSETVDVAGSSYEVSAYLNVGTSPHTLDPSWAQPALTMFITRLALEDCSLQPYQGLLGIVEGEFGLPTDVDALALDQVPEAHEAGIEYPLDYE